MQTNHFRFASAAALRGRSRSIHHGTCHTLAHHHHHHRHCRHYGQQPQSSSSSSSVQPPPQSAADEPNVDASVSRLLEEIADRQRHIPGYRVRMDHSGQFPLWEELPYDEMTEDGYTHKLRIYLRNRTHLERDHEIGREGWAPVFDAERYTMIEFDDFDMRPRWLQLYDLQSDMEAQLRELFERETEREMQEGREAMLREQMANNNNNSSTSNGNDNSSSSSGGGSGDGGGVSAMPNITSTAGTAGANTTTTTVAAVAAAAAFRTRDDDHDRVARLGYTSHRRMFDVDSLPVPQFDDTLRGRWEWIKFELQWRYMDLKNQNTAGLPTPETIRYKHLSWHDAFDTGRLGIKFWSADIRAKLRVLRRRAVGFARWISGRNRREYDERRQHEEHERVHAATLAEQQRQQQRINEQLGLKASASTTEAVPQQQQQQQQPRSLPMQPPEPPFDMERFIKDRASLVVKCMNQFIVGYNEGLGRDTSQVRLFNDDILKQPTTLSRDKWMDTVSTVARKAREFQMEATNIATVKDEDMDVVDRLSKKNKEEQRQQPQYENTAGNDKDQKPT